MSEINVQIGVGTWEDGTFRAIVSVNDRFTVYEDEVFTDKEAARAFAKEKANQAMYEFAALQLNEGKSVEFTIKD